MQVAAQRPPWRPGCPSTFLVEQRVARAASCGTREATVSVLTQVGAAARGFRAVALAGLLSLGGCLFLRMTGLFSRSLIAVHFYPDKKDSFSVLFIQCSSLHWTGKFSCSQRFPLHLVVEFLSISAAVCFPSPAKWGGKEKAKAPLLPGADLVACLMHV